MNTKPITAEALLRDIRAHCVDCMGGQRGMVAFCTSEKCRLWPHRMPPEEQERVYRVAGADEPAGLQLSMMGKETMA